MDNQHLAAVDLNLLVAFEALLIERNVSRAARRLGVAEPTMSNALNPLRTSLGDELFVRTPEEMRPTPRVLDLAEPVREALQQIRSMLKPSATFDPVSAQRRFVIGASDNVDFALAPGLVSVRRAAPGITIEIPSVPHQTAIAMLDDGSLDLAVGLSRAVPKRMDCVTLY
jgi:DNA-binding transcriptional LysR family regulator